MGYMLRTRICSREEQGMYVHLEQVCNRHSTVTVPKSTLVGLGGAQSVCAVGRAAQAERVRFVRGVGGAWKGQWSQKWPSTRLAARSTAVRSTSGHTRHRLVV